jgi:antitoxin component YwqK of YwqJK toxin-antitoxin module
MNKNPVFLLILLLVGISMSCKNKRNDPGQLTIKNYKIGDKVDTTLFNKIYDLYLPNYLDGWTMDNTDQLPEKYIGLPVAIWQQKNDSSIALTLLGDMILNISVSYMGSAEKNMFSRMATEKFGAPGEVRSYKEEHPLQEWITYWDLETWQTKDVIFQIGTSDMRKPKDPKPGNITWNLIYSDHRLEDEVIGRFKKVLFSNVEDSLKYQRQVNAIMNRGHPPTDGVFTDYFDNGVLKERGNYKDGKKDGLWETWFENGQKEDSAFYVKDDLSGTRIMWHPNGQLQLQSQWGRPDDRIGKWVRYYENGQIESITYFNNNGEMHGKALQYFENGKLQRETVYDREQELSDILFNEQAQRIK